MPSTAAPQLRGRKKFVFWSIYLVGSVVLGIVFLEVLARAVAGPPSGSLSFLLASRAGLYPPSSRLELRFGPIPYTVHSNSLGLRGPEVAIKPTSGTTRIACIGDSITDGFFVEDEYTYPRQLEAWLRKRGYPCEVLSIARGGCTIDLQLARLRQIALGLQPQIVVLTFVSNDIYELKGKTRQQVLEKSITLSPTQSFINLFLANSRLGEALFQVYIHAAAYRAKPTERALFASPIDFQTSKPPTPGELQENVRIFWHRYGEKDGIVHAEKFTSETEGLLSLYLEGLRVFDDTCRAHGVKFVFVYYPSYPQVYDPRTPMTIRDRLQQFCSKHGIPFADLTHKYRERPRDRAYEYAPLDFHPNPQGNAFLAKCVGEFLVERGFLEQLQANPTTARER